MDFSDNQNFLLYSIKTEYIGYGLLSMVATAMSVIIRLELSGPDAQFTW